MGYRAVNRADLADLPGFVGPGAAPFTDPAFTRNPHIAIDCFADISSDLGLRNRLSLFYKHEPRDDYAVRLSVQRWTIPGTTRCRAGLYDSQRI
jgi:hypothetical protein